MKKCTCRSCTKVISNESLTQQHFKDECDINQIMARYEAGTPVPVFDRQMVYGDFAHMPSFRESMDMIVKVRDYFDGLPARVKQKFENDPQQMIDYLDDPKNFDEAVKLGLAVPQQMDISKEGEKVTPPSKLEEDGE